MILRSIICTLGQFFFVEDILFCYKIDRQQFIHSFIDSLIHSVFCLTSGPKPPPKRFLHIVRSRASSFKWEYPLLSLRSSISFLRLLPRLHVTSISPFIFPSITCFRRQFLRKMWPIQLAFRFLISCRIFLCSLTLSNTSSFLTWNYIYIYIYCTLFIVVFKCISSVTPNVNRLHTYSFSHNFQTHSSKFNTPFYSVKLLHIGCRRYISRNKEKQMTH